MKQSIYDQIDTPSLLIDHAKMENNLLQMAELCKSRNIKLRPHIKTHKIPQIALRQIKLSNNGIAVSKLGEAEVMLRSGIRDIVIANEIIGQQKILRLSKLMQQGEITICVDSVTGIRQLDEYLYTGGKRLKVLIEVDTGMNRCGVSKIDQASNLIQEIDNSSKLTFSGFLSHSGNIYAASSQHFLERIAVDEATQIAAYANHFKSQGIPVNTLSIGSTPSKIHLDKIEGITEFRPGNYIFYDYIQVCLKVASIEECALTVLATIISRPAKDRVVIDAGSKCLGLDRGAHSNQLTNSFGYIKEYPHAVIERLSEEHGILKVDKNEVFEIGSKINIIPNHSCAVTNMFDEAYIIENAKVKDIWRIEARGKVT
jgi:D-serine deaminase-like pyridoxal phosphate-dependent protein